MTHVRGGGLVERGASCKEEGWGMDSLNGRKQKQKGEAAGHPNMRASASASKKEWNAAPTRPPAHAIGAPKAALPLQATRCQGLAHKHT